MSDTVSEVSFISMEVTGVLGENYRPVAENS